MFDKLRKLKNVAYRPDAIIDIGAHHGNWTKAMKSIYDDCDYYLFEAIDYKELNDVKLMKNVNVFNVLLNETAQEVNWYQKKNTGDSMFREKTNVFEDCEIIKRQSIDLDSFSVKNSILKDKKNILMKIDCQGAEIPILKGASSLLDKTDFIILEMPVFGKYNEGAPNFLEHIAYMDSIGFVIYEMLEDHYYLNFNIQVDILFINKNHKFNKIVNELFLHLHDPDIRNVINKLFLAP